MVIGITGVQGSGKSFLTRKLNKNNEYIIIDVDKLVHDILKREDVKNEMVLKYGQDILTDLKIDTKKIGRIIFLNKKNTEQYNLFIWRYISKELEDIFVSTDKDIILDWALLPLSRILDKCDIKVLVISDFETRKKRIMLRDNISEEYFINRENHSLEYNENDYDAVINSNDIEELKNIIERRKNI